ncbi:MAG: molybdate ABC transporter substrate-binding protein [Gallionella sp.]|nr:molybdate ABC transporter substrate-binding protein [Gallionella sp.]
MRRWLLTLLLLIASLPAHAGEQITIAAAADLKFAMDEIIGLFGKSHPDSLVTTIYGSSGNIQTQIRQGAPYDLYFSADIAYPRTLKAEGLATGEVQPYALGRIVLWSVSRGALKLSDLTDPSVRKIAIANPGHAPYGKRAEEALKAAGVWDKVEAKLVYGENVAQTAQFVQTGNADVGIIALSQAMSAELSRQGSYTLIAQSQHQPLEQGFILTRRATNNAAAHDFARFMASKDARTIMIRYGFALPAETK